MTILFQNKGVVYRDCEKYCSLVRHTRTIIVAQSMVKRKRFNDGVAYSLLIKPYQAIFVRANFDNILAILY